MKRILTLILVLSLVLSVFVGCDMIDKITGKTPEGPVEEQPTPDKPDDDKKPEDDKKPVEDTGLADATNYVNLLYKDFTPGIVDYDLVGKVDIQGVKFTVTWKSNNDKVVIKESTKATMWTVDLPETNDGEFSYSLTATISDANGNSNEKTFTYTMPALIAISIPEALAAADDTEVVVKGTVCKINTPWSEGYKNISVTIKDDAGNELYLYRLSTKVEVGDIIVVSGKMATYNNSRQIAQGATALKVGHADLSIKYTEMTIPQALAAADGVAVKVTGTVYEINTAWSDDYGNITVTIKDDAGNSLYVYRLFTKVELGDVIVVEGYVGSYKGAKQIAEGSTATITGHVDITTPDPGTDPTPDPDPNPNPNPGELTIVTSPEVGVAYKFGLFHGNESSNVFFNGQNYNNYAWYLAYSAATTDAVDVYLESVEGVEGGYRMYFMNGDAKTYIRVYQDSRSGHENDGTLELTTSVPEEYFTFSTEYNTLLWTNANGAQSYLGSSGTYKSISCSNISYITNENSYIAHLYAAGTGSDTPVVPHEHNFVDGKCSCGATDPDYVDPNPGTDPTPDPEVITTIPGALAGAVGAEVNLTGTVVGFYETWSSYNNCSPYIEDADGNKILVFRTTTNVCMGDKINVVGVLGEYNSVKQVAQGSTVTITEAHTCDFASADCVNPSKCKLCGAVAAGSTALGHNYVDGTCTLCGGKQPSANTETVKYNFSEFFTTTITTTSDVKTPDGVVTFKLVASKMATNKSGQLRVYQDNEGVLTSTKKVSALTFTAQGKDSGSSNVTVYVSNDGITYVEAGTHTFTSSAEYTFNFDGTYTYIKIAAAGKQLQIKDMTFTFEG